jgi:hypothetical protein
VYKKSISYTNFVNFDPYEYKNNANYVDSGVGNLLNLTPMPEKLTLLLSVTGLKFNTRDAFRLSTSDPQYMINVNLNKSVNNVGGRQLEPRISYTTITSGYTADDNTFLPDTIISVLYHPAYDFISTFNDTNKTVTTEL